VLSPTAGSVFTIAIPWAAETLKFVVRNTSASSSTPSVILESLSVSTGGPGSTTVSWLWNMRPGRTRTCSLSNVLSVIGTPRSIAQCERLSFTPGSSSEPIPMPASIATFSLSHQRPPRGASTL
jgi:hypothetical protein